MFKISKIKILNYFRPNIFVKSIDDIDPSNFKQQGFRMVICDLDNTLVPHFTKTPTKKVIDFVDSIKQQGLLFIVASNNTKKRVSEFCEKLKPDDYIYNSMKPSLWKIKKLLKKYNINSDDLIIIGDQLITDICVANRLQCKSILTLPLVDSTKKNGWILNFIDHYIYNIMQHNNMLNMKKEPKIDELYEIL